MRTAFEYGEYDAFYADARTKKAMKDIDVLAKKMGISYALIGGMASYLNVKKNPEDFPDIDILVYSSVPDAKRFIKALAKKPKYHIEFIDDLEDAVFAGIYYDKDVQIDVFTSLDDQGEKKTHRIADIETELIEPLIIEKLIRSTEADIRIALDLLAFADYDRKMLTEIGREWRVTGVLQHAIYLSRRLKAGILTKSGLDSVVKRMAKA